MKRKIIVFGFPHCGTSILKSVVGHINKVDEIFDECHVIKKIPFTKHIVCKYPFTLSVFFTNKYKSYIKIFIIRNPIWVFSSLNKRFNYDIPEDHGIQRYIQTVKQFIHYQEEKHNNMYLIRYEDMFDKEFENLKAILDAIGLKYTNKIFDNTQFTNKIISSITKVPKLQPKNVDHGNYRMYQINQPFENKNKISKIDITEEQKYVILNDNYIKQVYPNINSYFK